MVEMMERSFDLDLGSSITGPVLYILGSTGNSRQQNIGCRSRHSSVL